MITVITLMITLMITDQTIENIELLRLLRINARVYTRETKLYNLKALTRARIYATVITVITVITI